MMKNTMGLGSPRKEPGFVKLLGLKAIKTEMRWLLVWIVLEQERVVQKNCNEALQCHRNRWNKNEVSIS